MFTATPLSILSDSVTLTVNDVRFYWKTKIEYEIIELNVTIKIIVLIWGSRNGFESFILWHLFLATFCVKLALFKCNFLRDPLTESMTFCVHMKAENQRSSKLPLLGLIGASQPKL